MRALAIDLFTRANAADQPNTSPHPLQRWSVVDAPKVAQCLHACAVVLDGVRSIRPLTSDELQMQRRALQRSMQLATQATVARLPAACAGHVQNSVLRMRAFRGPVSAL